MDKKLKIFFVNCLESPFTDTISPLREEDRLITYPDDIVRFLQTEGNDYTVGFFYSCWMDILAGGGGEDRWNLIINKLVRYKNANQPWFVFTGGARSFKEPFESEYICIEFLETIYEKVKSGKICTPADFYKNIGYK